jgi:hypothetical protein
LKITDPFNSADNQNCSYSHDDLVRIASVNCGAATWQQNFSYDAFGNLNKTVPTGGTGNSFQPTYSPTTNRMTNIAGFIPSYDATGNVLNAIWLPVVSQSSRDLHGIAAANLLHPYVELSSAVGTVGEEAAIR